jgi:hypothetical protein
MSHPEPPDESQYNRQSTDSNLPIPDPTRLTTQLVDRALAAFREVVETRLGAMDRATKLIADNVDRVAGLVAEQQEHLHHDIDRQLAAQREYLLAQIENVASVGQERFSAVATQFAERDTRIGQAEVERQKSLDAALAAAKEAVSEQNKANSQAIAKSEVATQKQIDALVALMTTSNKSLDEKIVDLRTRLDQGEGRTGGHQDSTKNLVTIVGLVLTAVTVLVGLWLAFGGK